MGPVTVSWQKDNGEITQQRGCDWCVMEGNWFCYRREQSDGGGHYRTGNLAAEGRKCRSPKGNKHLHFNQWRFFGELDQGIDYFYYIQNDEETWIEKNCTGELRGTRFFRNCALSFSSKSNAIKYVSIVCIFVECHEFVNLNFQIVNFRYKRLWDFNCNF